ncbi:hypothetical protein ACFL3S_06175 [Gemmatimonadota bacterium]
MTPLLRLPRPGDLAEAGMLSVAWVAAWFFPERLWRPFCLHLGRLGSWLRPTDSKLMKRRIEGILNNALGDLDPKEIQLQTAAGYLEVRVQVMRERHPRGWNPEIQVHGRHHVEEALEEGRGAILWVYPTTFRHLATKKAFHLAGFSVSHLGRPDHGFSSATSKEFVGRITAPMRVEVEDRYLDERITIPDDDSLAYVRRIQKKLRENGLVSIISDDNGRRVLDLPVLKGRIRLATGPASLAMMTGAALLPVATFARDPGAFDVWIEPPLRAGSEGGQADGAGALVQKYVLGMERYLLSHPGQWSGWQGLFRVGAEE